MIRSPLSETARPPGLRLHDHGRGPLRGAVLSGLGWISAALAVLGVILPLLPATPFALIAAWAFARSSPRLERRLNDHPLLGPLLRDWRARRAVPRRAKAVAVGGMGAGWLTLAALAAPPPVLALAAAVMAGVGAWLVTRPE